MVTASLLYTILAYEKFHRTFYLQIAGVGRWGGGALQMGEEPVLLSL